jgi:hypothetical protein
MKKSFLILLVVFAVTSSSLFAQAPPEPVSPIAYQKIESNYLKGLKSDNASLRISCAYFLGQMKSDEALIPLMAMFHDSKNESAKLIAAWSLLKIGDARGVNLVKRADELGECSSYAGCVLHYIYMDYCLQNNGRIDKSLVVQN